MTAPILLFSKKALFVTTTLIYADNKGTREIDNARYTGKEETLYLSLSQIHCLSIVRVTIVATLRICGKTLSNEHHLLEQSRCSSIYLHVSV